MPKYGIHHIVLRRAIDLKLSSGNANAKNAAALLNGEADAAMLGAVGPDLFFFAPDYPVMPPIIALYTNYKKVLDLWDDIMAPIRQINEQFVEPVQEKVEDVLGEDNIAIVKLALEKIKETGAMFGTTIRTGLLSGVVAGVNDIFSAANVPVIQGFFQEFFTPEFQKVKNMNPMSNWFWFDILHYRRTGLFARNLALNATTARQKAYAHGYLSHIATDVTGHAFVNQITGAPYRLNVQRHVTAENFMDTWAFDHYFQESVSTTLMQRLQLTDSSCTSDIASLLVKTLNDTYQSNNNIFTPNVKATLTVDEITETYVTFHGILGIMAGMGIERPEEPFAGVLDILEKAWQDVIQPPPSPPDSPEINCTWEDMLGLTSKSGACWKSLFEGLAEWLSWLGELAIWLIDRIAELLDFLIAALLSLPVMVLLAILYGIQLLLFELYRIAHWNLSMQGFVFPLRDDLGNSVSKSLVQTDLNCVGNLSAGNPLPNRSTRYPRLTQLGDSHLLCPFRGSEQTNRIWNFLTTSAPFDPRQFIEALPFSQQNMAEYAQAATPADSFSISQQGKTMGNAVDMTAFMIATANNPSATTTAKNTTFANWNLDGDRGYGYKTWTGGIGDTAITGEEFV